MDPSAKPSTSTSSEVSSETAEGIWQATKRLLREPICNSFYERLNNDMRRQTIADNMKSMERELNMLLYNQTRFYVRGMEVIDSLHADGFYKVEMARINQLRQLIKDKRTALSGQDRTYLGRHGAAVYGEWLRQVHQYETTSDGTVVKSDANNRNDLRDKARRMIQVNDINACVNAKMRERELQETPEEMEQPSIRMVDRSTNTSPLGISSKDESSTTVRRNGIPKKRRRPMSLMRIEIRRRARMYFHGRLEKCKAETASVGSDDNVERHD